MARNTNRPLIWTHAFVGTDPSFGWVPEYEEYARKLFDFVTFEELEKNPEKASEVKGALLDGACFKYLKQHLDKLSNLKILANNGAGVNHLDIAALAVRGIKVSNTPDVLNNAVAELTLALVLSSARDIFRGNYIAKNTVVPTFDSNDMRGVEVGSSTVGVVGMGNIGLKIAQLLQPFGANIVYHNRTRRSEDIESSIGATYYSSLDVMLPVCDFIILICPLTPQTNKLISSKQFELMKNTATIVNVARGGVVDTDALVDALKNKKIRAAALDVTDPEPLPDGHELRSLDNVIITPHWGSQTFKTRFDMFKTSIKNLKAGLIDFAPLPNEVKP